MANTKFDNVAIGDIGTQLFHFNEDAYSKASVTNDNFNNLKELLYTESEGEYTAVKDTVGASFDASEVYYVKGAFEYLIPVTAGAEFGGETESFDAPETDLDYVPKVMGRKTLNDVSYTINYTAEKYKLLKEIAKTGRVMAHTYMEVFSDNSAMIFKGTANEPSITAGDVRQMTYSIIPSYMEWVSDIYNIDDDSTLDSKWFTDTTINIDVTTIPDQRKGYADTDKNAEA